MTTTDDRALMKRAQTLASDLLATKTDPTPDELDVVAEGLQAASRAIAHKQDVDEDAEWRRRIGEALREPDQPPPLGTVGRFSAKSAGPGIVKQIVDGMRGSKSIAPSGQAVSPAGLSLPQPISLDRPTVGLLPLLQAQATPTPPTVSFLQQTARTNNAAVVAEGGTKPTSIMTLQRIDTVLQVVATLSEKVSRFWLSDSPSLLTWIQQELLGNVDVATEALVFSTLGSTSGVQTATDATDPLVALRKGLTKTQLVGGAQPFVAMHPNDFETISLLRATTNEFIATDSAIQSVPDGQISAPYGPTALLSWGMPIGLSIACTPKTAWILAADAVLLFTAGGVMVDWSDSTGFQTNEVVGRAECRVFPAVTKPLSCVKVTLP